MIKRFIGYACLALAACLSFSVPALAGTELPRSMIAVAKSIGDLHGGHMARYEATMVAWRSASDGGGETIKSNLIATGNHYTLSQVLVEPKQSDPLAV